MVIDNQKVFRKHRWRVVFGFKVMINLLLIKAVCLMCLCSI